MTDSELKKAFSKGFANPQHLTDLLKRTDLPQDRLIDVRTNLSQAHISGKITKEALQRFISQLSKAKSLNQFDQVHAELRHANRLIESGVVAQNSLVFVSAKKGRQYDLGGTIVKIDPVHEADALYLGTDGLIHLHEVKNTATALRNKLQKKPAQLENMLDWRDQEPDKREITMVIGTEAGWTQLFAKPKGYRESTLEILSNNEISLMIGEYHLTVEQMQKLWYGMVNKAQELSMYPPRKEFFDLISTLDRARKVGISWE
ncbi:MAG: hypothetical protein ACPGWR_01855 [Ardenticatenaceae bacterium]